MMRAFLFGDGALLDTTAHRLQQLAERHGVHFVREPSRFRVEAEKGSEKAAAFSKALKRDATFYEQLEKEAELVGGGTEDEDDIPW
ncbi:hypothetical protein LVJ94_34730 [Pendulispora rubella]|uniref:Uncharacterized protein n=1 Tax=Pendulispora rubella TaxID=2741070 RepID=A0ABZ2KWW9_9BACT